MKMMNNNLKSRESAKKLVNNIIISPYTINHVNCNTIYINYPLEEYYWKCQVSKIAYINNKIVAYWYIMLEFYIINIDKVWERK